MNREKSHPLIQMLLAILVCAVTAGSTFGQERAIHIQRIDITKLPEIMIYMTVLDARGESVLGLTERELDITIDGTIQRVTSLRSAFEGGEFLAVALLFDRSGSMKNAIESTKESGMAFLERMSEGDQIAVISFDHTVLVESGFTADRAESKGAISRIVLGGDTALYDAIKEGLDLLASLETPRQAIIVLSDGKDTKSRLDRAAVLGQAKTAGVPVFAINLDTGGDENNLKDLASQTGGNYFEAATPSELRSLYQIIADQLNNQYVLSFSSSSGEDEKFHNLEITFKDPSGSSVSAKREYVASRGPGVRLDTVSGLKKQVEKRSLVLYAGIGAALGFILGLGILILLRAARPDLRMLSLLGIALLLTTVIFGAILGAIVLYLM